MLTQSSIIIRKYNHTNKSKLTMKFSIKMYFMIALVMTYASNFGMANKIAPDMSVNDRRELEIKGMEQYSQDMELVDAINGDRNLGPDISCYTMWCLGKVRGTCWSVYPKCYPL